MEARPEKFDPSHMRVLEEEKHSLPARVLDALDVAQGHHVLDVGCGTGALARPAARRVGPEGRVVAVDVQPEMLEQARRLAAEEGVDGIEFAKSTERHIPVPEGSMDSALLVNVLHELKGLHTLVAIRRALRPCGRLALADWSPDAPLDEGPPLDARMTPEEARVPLEEAGFRLVGRFDAGARHYGLLFASPPPQG